MLIVLLRINHLEIATLKRRYSYVSPPFTRKVSDTSSPHSTIWNYTLELYHIYVEYIHKNKMEKPHLQ